MRNHVHAFNKLWITSLFQNAFDFVPVALGLIGAIILEIIRALSRMIWGVVDSLLFWPNICIWAFALGFTLGIVANAICEFAMIRAYNNPALKAPEWLNWVVGLASTTVLELLVFLCWKTSRTYDGLCEAYQESWYYALTAWERASIAVPTAIALLVTLITLAVIAWVAWTRSTTLRLKAGVVVGYVFVLTRAWSTMVDLGLPLWLRVIWTVLQVFLTVALVLKG